MYNIYNKCLFICMELFLDFFHAYFLFMIGVKLRVLTFSKMRNPRHKPVLLNYLILIRLTVKKLELFKNLAFHLDQGFYNLNS